MTGPSCSTGKGGGGGGLALTSTTEAAAAVPAALVGDAPNANGLTSTFHLRQGVKNVQGNPLTAGDVVWSFERKWKAEGSLRPTCFSSSVTEPAKQLRKIDDRTVAITVTEAGCPAGRESTEREKTR
ncbi:ABC transporter substrate-binding protein [Amycolatopsis panacis]|uniref:Solute-binding protein family 5 domain-containing protein n=1 Tax=Amycolatopsis panacis TaxID=2340917 RepID=A0A419I2J8_9PSEU|nr:ABC transporter substrate-binding protein [Amycolatopsis panacis]RJQ84181.1 hypothetical protein D5S19_17775 [Amycolatopsis panacis]